MTYGHYQSYIEQRWHELGVPGDHAAILERFGKPAQRDINRWLDTGDPRGTQIWHELQELHARAFHQALSELHFERGHKDVGAGLKLSGTRYLDRAEDIVALKPINSTGGVVAEGPVQLVDAVFALGGVDARVEWRIEAPNAERAWTLPLPLAGEPSEPGPGPIVPPPPDGIPPAGNDEVLVLLHRVIGDQAQLVTKVAQAAHDANVAAMTALQIRDDLRRGLRIDATAGWIGRVTGTVRSEG